MESNEKLISLLGTALLEFIFQGETNLSDTDNIRALLDEIYLKSEELYSSDEYISKQEHAEQLAEMAPDMQEFGLIDEDLINYMLIKLSEDSLSDGVFNQLTPYIGAKISTERYKNLYDLKIQKYAIGFLVYKLSKYGASISACERAFEQLSGFSISTINKHYTKIRNSQSSHPYEMLMLEISAISWVRDKKINLEWARNKLNKHHSTLKEHDKVISALFEYLSEFAIHMAKEVDFDQLTENLSQIGIKNSTYLNKVRPIFEKIKSSPDINTKEFLENYKSNPDEKFEGVALFALIMTFCASFSHCNPLKLPQSAHV